jgi:hypothetical protein
VIDPRHLTLTQWTDAVNLALASSGPTLRLQGQDWRGWAYNILSLPKVAALAPPDPRGFVHWLPWAERFVQAVPL